MTAIAICAATSTAASGYIAAGDWFAWSATKKSMKSEMVEIRKLRMTAIGKGRLMKLTIDLIFGRIAMSMDGYKTLIGGIGLILLGVTGLVGHYWPDSGVPGMEIDAALGHVAAGLGVLGIGHKVEKSSCK